MTMYYLVTASCAIPLGRLGDKFGYLHVTIFCTVACCILLLSQFFIKNYVTLLIFRALTGFSTAGIIANRNTMNRILPPGDNA